MRAAIFGATSGIATAVARQLAEAGGARLILLGRNAAALKDLAADLRVRGAAEAQVVTVDFATTAELPKAVEAAWAALGGLDLALVAYGSLPDQPTAEADPSVAEVAMHLNFTSPALLCDLLASRFADQGSGTLAVITSVAGDRGRRSNYVYGAAKGGLQRFLEGLRHRLARHGVAVLDIRPGFVATRMTAHLPQSGPLWADPDRVARDILSAARRRKAVLYTPWFWRGVMAVVRGLPRPIFHRTGL